jgi:nicotinamide riboside kinase
MSAITEIYIIGPSSTGKTTLCRALSTRLRLKGPTFINEVARDVMERGGYTRNDVGKLEMQVAIMEAQLLRENEARVAAARAERIVLSDRSAIDAIVYAVLNSANEDDGQRRFQKLVNSPRFQLALTAYRQSVIVLLTPVPEWLVDDGIRSMDNQVNVIDGGYFNSNVLTN